MRKDHLLTKQKGSESNTKKTTPTTNTSLAGENLSKVLVAVLQNLAEVCLTP